MPITSYYGNSDLETFLDYGERAADGSARNVQRHLEGQDAYDQWHLALYMKDYFRSLDVSRQSDFGFSNVPRPDKNVLGLLFAEALGNCESICELGSTLFEVIEGFKCAQNWLARGDNLIPRESIDLEHVEWVGVEISPVFRYAAELLHPSYDITHVESTDDIVRDVSLLLDRSVSNYCFDSSLDFAHVVNRTEAAFLNSYFSLESTFYSTRYAKQLTYFSLEEFVESCVHPVVHLYGFTAPRPIGDQDLAVGRPVVEGFWFAGPTEVLDRFVAKATSFPEVRMFLESKDFKVTAAKDLLVG